MVYKAQITSHMTHKIGYTKDCLKNTVAVLINPTTLTIVAHGLPNRILSVSHKIRSIK